MVKFRMSMKTDRGDGKSHHISIPQKDAIAIVPPKKVIKALYDYSAPDRRHLSFSQGDFLHVVGREDDTIWYEACNPLQNTKGLVPVRYFETVGKQARNSRGSANFDHHDSIYTSTQDFGKHDSGNHDSGYGSAAAPSNDNRMSQSMSRTGAMVYGVVMYDFRAERADELNAKEGEAIIVIAQSNPEWFVAKPITRLGGPGLIPVSFIEIRDMATNRPVEDPQEAIQRAGVPKVEEWKKMAAEYKNGSIPLGSVSQGNNGTASLQQSMARVSLSNGRPQHQHQYQRQHQKQQSRQQSPGSQAGRQHQRYISTDDPTGPSMQPPRNGPIFSNSRAQQDDLVAPTRASVPRYCFADDIFWFIVEAEMEDGRHWELQRLYQDFYDLQINLIQHYPREAGDVPGVERCLPYMPGPVTYVTDNISNGRRANLDEYIRNLLKIGSHITHDYLVCKFFAPREGDFEIDPDVEDLYKESSDSQGRLAGHQSVPTPSSTSGISASTGTHASYDAMRYSAGKTVQSSHGHSASQTNLPALGNPYGQVIQDQNPQQLAGLSGGGGLGAIRIKVFFGPENCVIIRLPPDLCFQDLYEKLQDRRRLEPGIEDTKSRDELDIFWRDDQDKLWRMSNDGDLQAALSQSNKLTLNVRPV